jgi:hypothetical protein
MDLPAMKTARLAALAASLLPVSFACAGDLSAYEGKYPFETVAGYAFFENPAVAGAIDAAGGKGTAEWINELGVTPPIEVQNEALVASACEAGNCSGNSAAVALSLTGELIALCLFSESGARGTVPGKLHWVGPGLDADTEAGSGFTGCPRDGAEFLESYTGALH